jgi:hypothetical protein
MIMMAVSYLLRMRVNANTFVAGIYLFGKYY